MVVLMKLVWLTLVFLQTAVQARKLITIKCDYRINDEFPFLVGLTNVAGNNETGHGASTETSSYFCSGTLVSPDFVLSSAYCMSRLQPGKIRVYKRTSMIRLRFRLGVEVYIHPQYIEAQRLNDLSLIKLKKPFANVNRFATFPPSTMPTESDHETTCTFVGIRAPISNGCSYKVPVRAKYGRTACETSKTSPVVNIVIGATRTDFMCTRTVVGGPSSSSSSYLLPCDRSDPLLCHGKQYGIFSYGYSTGATPGVGFGTAASGSEPLDCGDPTVQSRSLLVNRHVEWITGTMSGKEDRNLPKDYNKDGGLPHRTANSSNTSSSTTKVATITRNREGRQLNSTVRDGASLDLENYPYLVQLQGSADEPVCGGTLISPDRVLTSAYCTTRMSEIQVTTTHGRQQTTHGVINYVHPDFDVQTQFADISVVVLKEPLNVTKYAEIADIYDPRGAEPTIMSCVVVAKISQAPYYYHTSVTAQYGPKACRKAADSEIQNTVHQTWREFICGLPDNTAFGGDKGNPLICNGKQYGVISHSYPIEDPNENVTDQTRFLAVKNYKWWITFVASTPNPSRLSAKAVKMHNGSEFAHAFFVLVMLVAVFSLLFG